MKYKKDELIETESIFSQNWIELKEIIHLQNIIENDDLNYKSKRGKTYNFDK